MTTDMLIVENWTGIVGHGSQVFGARQEHDEIILNTEEIYFNS